MTNLTDAVVFLAEKERRLRAGERVELRLPMAPQRPRPYMPGNRIHLGGVRARVDEVRLDRLQDVNEDEAKAEGADCRSDLAWDADCSFGDPYAAAVARGHRAHFRAAWEEKHPAGPEAWAFNPYVWVVTCAKVEDGSP